MISYRTSELLLIGRNCVKYRDLSVARHKNSSTRQWQITIFCDNRVQWLFYHLIIEFVFQWISSSIVSERPAKRSATFMRERSKEGEKRCFICAWAKYCSVCSQKKGRHYVWADNYCRHLFAGHVLGSRPRRRKKTSHRMIISDILMPRMQSVKVNTAPLPSDVNFALLFSPARKVVTILVRF